MRRHLVFTEATLERVDGLALDALFLFVDGDRPMRGLASHIDVRLNMRLSRALATYSKPNEDSAWMFSCEKKSSCARVMLLAAPSPSTTEHSVFSWMRKMRLRRVGVHFAVAAQEAHDFDAQLARFLGIADDSLPWDEFHVLCPPELHKRHGHVLEVFRRRSESDATL